MNLPLSVLHLEDDPHDAELIEEEIVAQGIPARFTLVRNREGFLRALESGAFDLVIADYNLPGFGGVEALDIIRERKPEVPFILVSGTVGEEVAVDTLKRGATDYVMKGRLKRLGAAIRRAMADVEAREAQRRIEAARQESESRYRVLIETSPDAIVLQDAQGRVLMANRRVVELVGATSPTEVIGRRLSEFLDAPDRPRGHEACDALRRGESLRDVEFAIRKATGARVSAEMSAAPVLGTNGLTEAAVVVVKDITQRKWAEAEIRRSTERVRKNLMDTAAALAATLEKRDPYTAGHQKRATFLATAIGRRIGIPEDRLAGVYIAGILHDVGKISVPAEILSKPAKLSSNEYELVKTHVETGYDIMKDIDFPWPVAEMIRQHHERLDGSGYPRGLKGDEIVTEARVLAVADVVEAMASHRPYRAALGVDAALAEIDRRRGLLYDPAVVDACIGIVSSGEVTFD